MTPTLSRRRRTLYRLLVFAVCSLAAAAICIALAVRARPSAKQGVSIDQLRNDPEIREQIVRRLSQEAGGVYDSFPDATVGRLLQPGMKARPVDDYAITSNAFGMRERAYEIPKPANRIRIVLLGDSFVMGCGAEEGVRLGIHLERLIQGAMKATGKSVECLHIGVNSWNIAAECAYLRRQMSLLQPDLVVQVIVPNDLEDCVGSRGFGAMSRFSSQQPERGTALLFQPWKEGVFGIRARMLLTKAVDFEGRSRYEQAGRDMQHLAEVLEKNGCRYLLLSYWMYHQKYARRFFCSLLRPEQVAYVPTTMYRSSTLALPDGHWNSAGHELVAKVLFGMIRKRGLLPQLELPAWTEADEVLLEPHRQGAAEAEESAPEMPGSQMPLVLPVIDFSKLKDNQGELATQINGGVDPEARAGPFVSLVLARGTGAHLEIRGTQLGRAELLGAKVRVLVEDVPVGEFAIDGGKEISLRAPLPQAVLSRTYLNVRLISDDFVYSALGQDLMCISYALQRVAIVE